MKRRKKTNWKLPLLIVLVILLILMLMFAAYLRWTHSVQQPQVTNPVMETVAEDLEPTYLAPTDAAEETIAETETDPPKGFQTIDLGEGIVLTGLAEAMGNFPEDGSDEFLPSMLSATFQNDSEKTLQYGKVKLTVNGIVYNFEFSTLPAGQTVRAFDLNKAESPQSIKTVEAEAEYMVFFMEEPQRYEDTLQFEIDNGVIRVKNISSKDITREISVFYKNMYSGIYMGGITYRLRINGLKAGEEVSGYASHAQKNASQVMFVIYED